MTRLVNADRTIVDEIDRHLHDHADRFRGWLSTLLAIDSEAPREREAQVTLVEIARSVGLDASLVEFDPATLIRDPRFIPTGMDFADRPNCVVRVPERTGRALVCNAHIDTVARGSGWTRNPLGEWVGDRLYGRGACDTKGSTVAALMAMSCLHELGVESSPFVLHSVIDEEPGGNGTLAQARSDLDFDRPRLVIVMEPTRLDFLSGHRGMLWYRLVCEGRAGHGSTGTGINAIEKAAEVILALRQVVTTFAESESGPYPPPSINSGIIHGGTEVYTTPDRCEIEISARYSFGQLDDLQQAIHVAIDACVLPGAVVEEFCFDFDAAQTPTDDADFAHALGIVRTHHAGALDTQLTGTCDMRHYRSLGGYPTAVFGPGSLEDAHRPDEYVEYADVELAARILVDIASHRPAEAGHNHH